MRKRPGVSLMELLMYMALSGIVVISMATFLMNMFATRVVIASQTSAQENARLLLERMTHAVRHGYKVQTASDSLTVFSHPASDPCATIYTVFQKNGDQFLTGTGPDRDHIAFLPAAGPDINVTNFTVTPVSSAVEIQLTTQRESRAADLTSTIAYRQSKIVCY